MVDPLTALSVASAAVSQIKQLTQAGRDVSSALGKFAGAISDVNYAAEKAKNPSVWKSLTGSPEAEAIEIFAAQKKMQAMRNEVETYISFAYGRSGLDEYKNTLRRVRLDREKHEYRKAEIKDAAIAWGVGILAFSSAIAFFGIVVYFIGRNQGKW